MSLLPERLRSVLIACDKFKGSLSSMEVGEAIRAGLHRTHPFVRTEIVPLTDGGEGTMKLLANIHDAEIVETRVTGPLFRPVNAHYAITRDGIAAFIEIAECCGLRLVPPTMRSPAATTTAGVGELIIDAIERGVSSIMLGLGGSATNDAGIGMAHALGFRFVDDEGQTLTGIGENLLHIRKIETDHVYSRLKDTRFTVLRDVDNPLHGPDGAAWVYGPQKGGDHKMLDLLDRGLVNFENAVRENLGLQANFPGAGAAGGLGAATAVFLGAQPIPGVDYFIEQLHIREKVSEADLVFTGEGKLDSQSLSGKVVAAIAALGKAAGKPVIAVCGKNELPDEVLRTLGIVHTLSLVNEQTSIEYALQHGAQLIEEGIAALKN